ncbi:hypothetical protein BLNAU_11262 [Blattamonas nauphoetae]|uniref:Conserved oligomeric Golgi complex subunit 3 C-terminal domain-containing protein n=1 Tax=Blattamonas nauphoetae TaxID=2049346 RepID=A0ABQ9XQF3_9EUKA|nr:hypothetical protein BLNAU_11262 [Blattamonas nauphoetae]
MLRKERQESFRNTLEIANSQVELSKSVTSKVNSCTQSLHAIEADSITLQDLAGDKLQTLQVLYSKKAAEQASLTEFESLFSPFQEFERLRPFVTSQSFGVHSPDYVSVIERLDAAIMFIRKHPDFSISTQALSDLYSLQSSVLSFSRDLVTQPIREYHTTSFEELKATTDPTDVSMILIFNTQSFAQKLKASITLIESHCYNVQVVPLWTDCVTVFCQSRLPLLSYLAQRQSRKTNTLSLSEKLRSMCYFFSRLIEDEVTLFFTFFSVMLPAETASPQPIGQVSKESSHADTVSVHSSQTEATNYTKLKLRNVSSRRAITAVPLLPLSKVEQNYQNEARQDDASETVSVMTSQAPSFGASPTITCLSTDILPPPFSAMLNSLVQQSTTLFRTLFAQLESPPSLADGIAELQKHIARLSSPQQNQQPPLPINHLVYQHLLTLAYAPLVNGLTSIASDLSERFLKTSRSFIKTQFASAKSAQSLLRQKPQSLLGNEESNEVDTTSNETMSVTAESVSLSDHSESSTQQGQTQQPTRLGKMFRSPIALTGRLFGRGKAASNEPKECAIAATYQPFLSILCSLFNAYTMTTKDEFSRIAVETVRDLHTTLHSASRTVGNALGAFEGHIFSLSAQLLFSSFFTSLHHSQSSWTFDQFVRKCLWSDDGLFSVTSTRLLHSFCVQRQSEPLLVTLQNEAVQTYSLFLSASLHHILVPFLSFAPPLSSDIDAFTAHPVPGMALPTDSNALIGAITSTYQTFFASYEFKHTKRFMTQLSQNAISLFGSKHEQFTEDAVKTLNDVEAAVNRQCDAPHSPLFYFCTFPLREFFSSLVSLMRSTILGASTTTPSATLYTSDAGPEMRWRSEVSSCDTLRMSGKSLRNI